MKRKLYIGIDPGKTGFISTIDTEGVVNCYRITLVGKEVDLNALKDIFEMEIIRADIDDIHCVIEDVHAIFGSSAKSTFEFGRILGMLEGLLAAYSIPFTKVQPKVWQKEMWQGIPLQKIPSKSGKTQKTDTKNMSILAVKRLFPNEDLRRTSRSKVNDHNKVDSLLMAEYCRRKF